MFKEFSSSIFKGIVVHGNFNRDIHHVKGKRPHPAGTICLLQLHFTGKMNAAVKYADIIKAKKPPFKNVVTINVLPVDPPREIDQEFLKNFLQKLYISF